jgi:hypothetical protein
MTDPSTPSTWRVDERHIRHVWIAGVVSTLLWVGALVVVGVLKPEPYANAWQLVGTHLVAGRVGNVLLGLNEHYDRVYLFFQCCMQDIISMLLMYPLVIAGYHKVSGIRYIGPALANVRAAAEKYQAPIARFGPVGLAAFVAFPLFSTGALVGAVIGYMLGMRPSVVFTWVTIGNIVAVLAWIYFVDFMLPMVEAMGANIWVILGALVAAGVLARLFKSWRSRRVTEPSERVPANVKSAKEDSAA